MFKGILRTINSHPAKALIALFFIAQLVHIFVVPVWGSSEAREAHVISSILNGDSILYPSRNGIVPSKPPFFHWLGASIGYCFQSSAIWVPRLVSLLASLGVLWMTMLLTRLFLANSRVPIDQHEDAVYLAVIIMLTSWLFFAQTTDAKVDMLFCFLIAVSLFLLARALFLRHVSPIAATFFTMAVAAAILTKGPLALVLLIALGTIILLSIPRPFPWKSIIQLLVYAMSGFMLASLWYLYGASKDGFIERHLFIENIQRLLGSERMNSEGPWFYLISLHRTCFPWILLPYVFIAKRYRLHSGVICFFAFVVLLSIASGKRHSYPLPVLPLFACGLSIMILEAQYIRSAQFVKLKLVMPFLIVVLVASTATGMYVKATHKAYPKLVQEIRDASHDRPLIVVKAWWDESFDVLMYLLNRPVAVYSPDQFQQVRASQRVDNALCLVNISQDFFDQQRALVRRERPSPLALYPCQ